MQTKCPAVVARVGKTATATRRAQSVRTKALATPYPYPEHGFKDEIVEEVIEAYPDKGIATNMEAMILFAADDYDVLDVRSKAEIEYVGNYPTAKKNRAVGERFHMIPLISSLLQI